VRGELGRSAEAPQDLVSTDEARAPRESPRLPFFRDCDSHGMNERSGFTPRDSAVARALFGRGGIEGQQFTKRGIEHGQVRVHARHAQMFVDCLASNSTESTKKIFPRAANRRGASPAASAVEDCENHA